MKLKGHETFTLREGWLNKGLYAVKKDPKVFSTNYGADELGVGSNMAKAIRYWLKAGELIQEKPREGARLTPIGELILEKDPYLEDIFSFWLFHAQLCCNEELATSWYLTFNEIESEEFSKEELFSLLKTKLLQLEGVDKIAERSLSDDVTVLLNMYLWERPKAYDPEDKKVSPFADLGLMKRNGTIYQKAQPQSSEKLNFIALYLIQRYFMEHKKEDKQVSISIDDLVHKAGLPGKVLNLKRIAVNEILDTLAAENYLTINRTAGLDMVYQESEMTPLEVAQAYYQ